MTNSAGITGIESHMKALEVGSEKPARALLSQRSIAAYTYTSLSNPSNDIRLLRLFPGVNEDPIIAQIDHARLIDRGSLTQPYLSQKYVDDIRESLPTGWEAFDTLGHRVLYFNTETESSTWQHPAVRDPMTSQENTFIRPAPDGNTDIPHYEALSYAWGSTESQEVIYVQNADGEHEKLLVTENLALALRHLRSTSTERTLWIDAICINQEDMEERNTQVQRMTSIYRLAHRVVVWLGPASHSSSLAMSTLEYLGEQVEIARGLYAYPSPQAVERHWYQDDVDLPYDVKTWEAVQVLLERPYFRRVWVMQEISLSNHRTIIQCGGDVISWMNMRKAVECLPARRNLPHHSFTNVMPWVLDLARYDARMPYDELSATMQARNCSNDRDRVYGLLGLMPEGLRERITPNYEITGGEVYRQATVAQIEFFQRLDTLRECGSHRAIDGPSWVPNLAIGHGIISFVRSAAGISRCYVGFDNPNVAEVSGLQVGTVNSVQEKEHWKLGEGIEHTKAWAYQDLDRDVYALTLCVMCVRERGRGFQGGNFPSLEEWKRFYYGEDEDTEKNDQGITQFFLGFIEGRIFSRTLFIMGDGRFGLGPETMKTGKLSLDGNT